MITCPSCSHKFKQGTVFATLVTGKIAVNLDDEGGVVQTSPIIAEVVVTPGINVSDIQGDMQCPGCKQKHPVGSFRVSRTCFLTGEAADTKVDVPNIGVLYLSRVGAELAQQLATRYRRDPMSMLDNLDNAAVAGLR